MERAIEEGMAVYDASGEGLGQVESLTGAHYFVTRGAVVTERIVVDADADVASVDDHGVQLRCTRDELLEAGLRPADERSGEAVSPEALRKAARAAADS